MRMNLKVPFAEKDEAKKLGARWDAARKIWYVADGGEAERFARWQPTPHDGAAAPVKAAPAKKMQESSHVVVGSAYQPQPRVCECLPWEDCEQCRVGGIRA